MFKIREDNTYNDIREKSLMSWLEQVQKEGSYNDACGAKLAQEYIEFLKKKIHILEEKNELKEQFLKHMKQKLNENK
ncbi:MAG: hypothetical protein Q4F21_06575 [Lachnospiraceae bacterium]|nr:hypothetical protein [Lachnospiraceae bacterium]